MTIPDYQSIMLPLLHLLADDRDHRVKECASRLALEFGLSGDEREQLLPSGRQSTLDNRVGWAATYLAKAVLVERPSRGVLRITDRGHDVLASKPPRIDNQYLTRFPEYVAFRRRDPDASSSQQKSTKSHEQTAGDVQTPAELMNEAYQRLRQALADDLLAQIKQAPPSFFEQLVVDLLVAMGYGGSRADAGQAVGRSGDGGVDGIINEDRLGLDVVYIQAKRWDQAIGRPAVQAFAGSLEGHRARKGVFITTSTFSRDAHDYVTRIEKRIVLIDGERLARYMIDHGVGVLDVTTYPVRRIDVDYFGEGDL